MPARWVRGDRRCRRRKPLERGRGSGVVGYDVQAAVETDHHLIIAHDVIQSGSDRASLAPMANKAKEALGVDELDGVADRGYFSSEQILECSQATLPKPMTTGVNANGQFGKPDFRYVSDDDVYICPAGQTLSFVSRKRQSDGLNLRRYATEACGYCALKERCTSSTHRVITRWEHEHLVDDVQRRLDENPQAMRKRRETVEHPFGTIKMRMGTTHFLMKTLKRVRTEIALSVLAYNLTRVINILGITPLIQTIRA